MKVLHLEYDHYPKDALIRLEERVELERFACTDQQQLLSKLAQQSYEVIFTRLGLMLDEGTMRIQPSLKYIVTATTGLNHIDMEAATRRRIFVISLKGESEFLTHVKSTAEHTWGLLLSLIRKLPAAMEHVKAGGWNRQPFLSDELDGKTLGIIGYGRLGKILANYGVAFGMRVLVHDRQPESYAGHTHVQSVDLSTLLANADVVCLLISWSEENNAFMNAACFSEMKTGAYFINTARGELVDEKALLNALESGKLKGAALDVLHGDSAWPGRAVDTSGLLTYAQRNNNLLITPHMGGYGKDSIAKTRTFVTNKFLSLINNHIS